MIWIDLEHSLPTDEDIPDWVPWTEEQWEAWKAKSAELVAAMAAHEAAGDRAARNELIDANSAHWGALKPWLMALSGGKCWFSETRDLYSHYDVEHFRPKKSAKSIDGQDSDGYWWLAFSYMNFRLCGNVGNRKKGGWFPLQAGSACASYANQCEDMEVRYFLDPIDIEDVKLVAFDEEGNLIPNPLASDWEKKRVETTALRLKLNEHDQLPEARRKIWTKTTKWVNQYLEQKSRCADGTNLVARQKCAEAARAIRELTRPTSELSVVARWCVEFRNDPRLARLAA
ncbi:MAG: hypothetical protein WA978_15865 [Sphingopyxis granuli]|uniref:hypothetical protein n=1 Tax=Sphingopyxis granuli TaxID=267128 RepID=UPI003C748791